MIVHSLITARKRSLGQGDIFTPVCHSVHRGDVRGCSRGGGRAWLLWGGGMHGCSGGDVRGCSGGACMIAPGGPAWLLLGGPVWLLWGGMRSCSGGACMVAPGRGDMHGIRRDTEIRSMSGRYASYWNAFLFYLFLHTSNVTVNIINYIKSCNH